MKHDNWYMKDLFSFSWEFCFNAEIAMIFMVEIYILSCYKISTQEYFILPLFQTTDCKKKFSKKFWFYNKITYYDGSEVGNF